MTIHKKCSQCGSPVEKIENIEGSTSYVLTAINKDKTPAVFMATSGMPVECYLCHACGHVELFATKNS